MAVLLGGHAEAVAVGEHLGGDLGDGLVGIAVFIHLDEVAVFSPASDVEDQGDVVLVRNAVDLTDVAHGDRLAADGVVGDAGENQRDILRADSGDELLELFDVHVALERVLLVLAAFGYLIQKLLMIEVSGDGAHLLDVALGGVEVAVGGDGEDLARMAGSKDLLDDLHQNGFRCAALLDDEGVGALHLGCAAVEQTALIFGQVDLFHHRLDVAAVGADKIEDLLPVLFAAAFKDIAEGVEQDIVAGVAAICLVAQEEGSPLVVGHGSGAGVREHINRQHAGGECELVIMGGLQDALALLDGNVGNVADGKGKVMGCGDIQRIFVTHNTDLHKYWRFTPIVLEIPRSSQTAGCRRLADSIDLQILFPAYRTAMHSISTSASFGRRATSTALRAGQAPSKNVAYTPFMAAKLFMSLRKTVVLITFSMAAPAAARTALQFSRD